VIALVLGGARSGKSVVAEQMAGGLAPAVTYVATLEVADDAELQARVERHRARRPGGWTTIDAGRRLPAVLRRVQGTVLVDSLGPWVAGAPAMEVPVEDLCRALVTRRGHSVVVSEEVGLGVHPSSAAGRRFRDALGALNQAVAHVADDVVLVVAGRVLRLDRWETP